MSTNLAKVVGSFILLLFGFGITATAQEKPSAGTVSVEKEKEEQAAKDKARKEAEKNQQPKSLTDSMFSNVQNDITFSFGLSENYSSNVFDSNVVKRGDTYTLFYPRVFANVQKKDLLFTVDYAFGYSLYNRFSELNRSDQQGTLQLRYQATRRLIYRLEDQLSYLPQYNFGAFRQPTISGNGPLPNQFGIVFDRQNVFRNVVLGEITYLASEPTSIRLYASYGISNYRKASFNNFFGYTAGFELANRISQRFSINADYEFLYYQFKNQFNISRIHRMGAGFKYEWRPTVTIYGEAGPELVNIQRVSRVEGFFRFGISRRTLTNSITLEGQRSVANDLGVSTAQPYYSVKVDASHLFTPKLNFGLTAGYYRGSILSSGTANLYGFQGGPRIEYAMRPNLTFIINYYYLTQRRADNVSFGAPPIISRHYVSVGFEYRLPQLLHH